MTLPPGPDSSPWLQAQEWIERPVAFWRDNANRFGDPFTVQLGSIGPTVLFGDPQAVRQIFQLATAAFECRQFNEHYKYIMGEHSLLVSDGPQHQRRRRLFKPLLAVQPAQHFAALVGEIAQRAVSQWPTGEAFNVRPSMHALSLQIMLRIIFGDSHKELSRAILRLFTSEVFHDFGTWSPWARFAQLQSTFRGLISATISRQQAPPESTSTSLLDTLRLATDEQGRPLDEAEIQDQVFTLLVAGVDPTAIVITWALYWILEAPAVQSRLLQELNSLGTEVEPARLTQLPYLKAVCQETLRMYPVVTTPSGRKLTRPVEILGKHFDPGVTLLPCTYLVHHREDLYPAADQFVPERFLEREYATYEYFPFGGGTRTCVGSALAYIEMPVILATILRTWELAGAHLGPVEPCRHGTLLAPCDAMRVTITGARQAG